jgi:hypothetical protein
VFQVDLPVLLLVLLKLRFGPVLGLVLVLLVLV